MFTSALKENKSPYERWYCRKSDIRNLRVFGCMAYAHVPDNKKRKLDKKADKLRFVGHSRTFKGYRLLDEVQRKVLIWRDVEFNEYDFGHKNEVVTMNKLPASESKSPEVEVELSKVEVKEEVKDEVAEVEAPQEIRKLSRARKQPVRYAYDEYAETASLVPRAHHVAYNVCQIDQPSSMEEAKTSCYAEEWIAAADSEYNSLIDNMTWKRVELSPGRQQLDANGFLKQSMVHKESESF